MPFENLTPFENRPKLNIRKPDMSGFRIPTVFFFVRIKMHSIELSLISLCIFSSNLRFSFQVFTMDDEREEFLDCLDDEVI